MKSRHVQKLDIFISSPSDVLRERRMAQKVIAELNKLPHISRHFTLNALAYEDTVPPGMGQNPQLMVDHYMMEAEKADIFICMLWGRMGTPVHDPATGRDYPSGTSYEFSRAYEAHQQGIRDGTPPRPRILLYRGKKRMPPSADPEQIAQVNAFFGQVMQGEFKGLFAEYRSIKAFEEMLRHDLLTVIEKDFAAASPAAEPVVIKPVTVVEPFEVDGPDALDTLLGRPNKLVGRDALLKRIPEQLQGGGWVLLQAHGGAGKTTLARRVAESWYEAGKGNVLWLKFLDSAAQQLFEGLGRHFGAADEVAEASGAAQIKLVRELLKNANVSLIVLDDVWNGEALQTFMNACPANLSLLVTARHRWDRLIIERVPDLAPEDAVQLLRAKAGSLAGNDADAHRLCEKLGYLAFAVELAGMTMMRQEQTVTELLRHYDGHFHDLPPQMVQADPARASVTALLETSLNELTPALKAAFFAFGAFSVPTLTADLLAYYLFGGADSARQAEGLLIDLHARGLVTRVVAGNAAASYRVHPLSYEYARTRFMREGAQPMATLEACQKYAQAFAEELPKLEAEINNLLGAVNMANQLQADGIFIGIMRALTTRGGYLDARGYTPSFLAWFDRAIQLARSTEPAPSLNLHFLLGKRGNIDYNHGELLAALGCWEEALHIGVALQLTETVVRLHCLISKVHADSKDFAAASASLDQAEAGADGSIPLQIAVLESRAYLAQAQDDLPNARRVFAQQLSLTQQLDDPEGLFYALMNLGEADSLLGDEGSAIESLERAKAVAHQLDNFELLAYIYEALAKVFHKKADLTQSCYYIDQAVIYCRKLGNAALEKLLLDFANNAGCQP